MDLKLKQIDFTKIYSPSRLDMFELCPKQYDFYYLDPVYSRMKNNLKKKPENIWPFYTLGRAVHNAITLFYHVPREERNFDFLKKSLVRVWESEVMPGKKPPLGKWGGFKTIEEEREAYKEALLMLQNFSEMVEVEPIIEYLPNGDFKRSIDDYISLTTPLSPDFDISGKFDLVINDQEGLQIVDFKTSKREKDDPFQLKFYKVLAEENFQKLVKKASFYFLKKGTKKEFDLEDEETEKIKEEILARVKRISQTEEFKPRPSKLCQYCLFRSFCPERGEVSQIIKDSQEEDYSDDLPF